ncbi:hypothetical protein ACFC26_44020 [Kitasatospora purpeofusca]|uniref:hypothetical protein n=1 Tax=Kitasatospora purpeofusca TaxID=67352 RepID=UPI0035DB4636
MSAQPHHYSSEPPGIRRTPDGIAAALTPARRMQFRAELGRISNGAAFERLLDIWVCRARLDQRPDRAERVRAARAGTLRTVTWDEIQRGRDAKGA